MGELFDIIILYDFSAYFSIFMSQRVIRQIIRGIYTRDRALFFFAVLIAVGLTPIATLFERPIHPLLSQPFEFGTIAVIEESLKWSLSLILFYYGAPLSVPIAVGAGFGVWEMYIFVSNGTPILMRIGALCFHIFTGFLLWRCIKKGRLWIGSVLIINILIHWWWNLMHFLSH